MKKEKLSDEEILYFYRLLHDYEHGYLKGYNEKKFLKLINPIVKTDDHYPRGTNTNITIVKDNLLSFTPYGRTQCKGILYHIRNSFAHGNLYSVSNGSKFLIQDYSDRTKRQKCNMLGLIDKEKFYSMIVAMKSTKKK